MNEKLARGVVLLGLMGCGKTSVGEVLAARLHLPYWDSDAELRATGGGADRIAAEQGGAALHHLEFTMLRDALALPGGRVYGAAAAVVEEPGIDDALRDVWTVWLRAPLDLLARRLRATPGDRPFMGGDLEETLRQMESRRAPLFAALADQIVDVTIGAPERIVEEIVGEAGAVS